MPIDRIQPHPENARRGDGVTIRRSIDHVGFYGTVCVQLKTGFILVGNNRWAEARDAGAEVIPVTWLDVDDETALEILAVDNRSSDVAKYDTDQLAALLSQIATKRRASRASRGLADEADLFDGTGYSARDVQRIANAAEGSLGVVPTRGSRKPDVNHVSCPKCGCAFTT